MLLYSLWIIALTVIPATSAYGCEISDPETHTKYDIRQLYADIDSDDIIPRINNNHDNFEIRLQLCFPLLNKCNNRKGYTVCMQHDNGTEKGIGKFPLRISKKDGHILLTFSGTICSGYVKYKTIISLQCDYEAGINTYPVIDNFDPDSCKIYMTWKTSIICPIRMHIDCTTTNNNEYYDLTSLTKYSENYQVRIKGISSKIVLNVCHSVICKHGAKCPAKTGAYIIDKKHKKYINLGNVRKPPFFANGRVQLEYQDGDLCDIENSISQRFRTTIIFICSSSIKTENTIPEYARIIGECHYEIIWYTPVACSIKSLLSNDSYVPSNCTTLNPITKSIYNLQPLMNRDYDIKSRYKEYKIRICGSLAYNNDECIAGTGVCDFISDLSVGKSNANLMWAPDGPYLHYVNGFNCDYNPDRYFSTYIKFICTYNQTSFKPMVMEEEICNMVECITNDTGEIDLTSLMRPLKNYIIKDEHNYYKR